MNIQFVRVSTGSPLLAMWGPDSAVESTGRTLPNRS